jgi:putative membrane protein
MNKYLWGFIYLTTLLWSAILPKDYLTWFLEVLPAIIGAIILLFTYQSFRLTTLLYSLILFHCIILMIGGQYTYAEVPFFDTLKDIFNFERNNYDKVGHFTQGFVPAIIAREILIRKNVVNGKAWLNTFIISICLAFSAFYELIEWGVAVSTGENAEAFLGTQGYVWDTQSDMAWALFGAISAIVLLAKYHDKQLKH